MEEAREALQPDDLKRIFIRSRMADGSYASISLEEATNEQFDYWIRTRLTIFGDDAPWTTQEKVDACNELWQAGKLHMLKKDEEE